MRLRDSERGGHMVGDEGTTTERALTGKPDDIPEDVWAAAAEPADVAFDASVDLYETGVASADVRLVVAHATLAERRRCAEVAGEHVFDEHELAQATEYGIAVHETASIIKYAILAGQP